MTMLQPVSVTRREGTSIEISRKLLDYLLSGRVQPGQRLPPERRLAETMGVGRSVVREALKSLTLLGLLEVRLGDGTYVKRVDAEVLSQSIEWGLVLGPRNILDLLEARSHIDVILAGLAAERRDEEALDELRTLLAEMDAARADAPRFAAAEAAFLRRVTDAAGNDVLGGGMATIRSLLQVWTSRLPDEPDHVRDAIASYGRLVDAIEWRDSTAARTSMGVAMGRAAERIRLALAAGVDLAPGDGSEAPR
ncbi:MAG: GntR family transcriptional regulator [Chloroflexi bacterium]|nr:GntR family transcriptional regulator [Chloroflexota bacterium]